MIILRNALLVAVGLTAFAQRGSAADPSALRLVPFPKQVRVGEGAFSLRRPLVLEVPAETAALLGKSIEAELRRAGLADSATLEVRAFDGPTNALRLSPKRGEGIPKFTFAENAQAEGYALEIRPDEVICGGVDSRGMFYGVQTLCQLIRANRVDDGLPCLSIRDWPSLRWRCFQDDMTRGPSSTLKTLKQHVDVGAGLKMNLFTYYMEYQYAFKKHPIIGPKDGSLVPDDLAALVAYAKPRQIDILGNQQSFGHLTHVLKHEKYAPLRETGYIICPVKEESYELLDDLYSEVCPLLPFEMFNVCCDETWGLGTGPSKALAEKIGVGGVYVQHIRRVHDLLKEKYQKRMMMWGDIILQHPDKLDQIPKDTVMLTWGYSPAASFEHQIVPFAKSGYEFFVCPGINNWSRILPDFGATTINIRHFVRDGAKHGAIGMLNTAWEDDGEALQGYKWHGYAWGAECAWNASTTTPEAFNRRIGAVLFGESGDHLGQAIELLAATHRARGMGGMSNRRFWQDDFLPKRSPKTIRAEATELLKVVRPAIEHLEACREEATVNAELLDAFLLGSRRMERIGQRMLDGLLAAASYSDAWQTDNQAKRLALLEEVEKLVDENRRAHAALGKEFERIWLSESKPFALDRTLDRYAALDKRLEALADRIIDARKQAAAGEPIPVPETLGLALPTAYVRRTRPQKIVAEPLESDASWAEPMATHRIGLSVAAGSVDRHELPIEVDVSLPDDLASKPVRAFRLCENNEVEEVLAQLDAGEKPGLARVVLMLPGPITKRTSAEVHVYLGLPKPPKALPDAVSMAKSAAGMEWIENDKVRLLLGIEGAHVYRWEVKAAENRDLTLPGETAYAGFCDAGRAGRSAMNKLNCTARGPALVRYVCTDSSGRTKTISLFGGASWIEVTLADPLDYYWDFDNPENFAADGPTPGEYLFANGKTGPVGKNADAVPAQVKAGGVRWAIKFNQQKLALGMTTPEVAANFVVGPGATAGGVGIEASPPAAHFVTFAGLLEQEPAETMKRLFRTLDFKNQPTVVLHGLEARP